MRKIKGLILPCAGRYAHDCGMGRYKWYDVVCYWLIMIIPLEWLL
jgi:hypothetical protein